MQTTKIAFVSLMSCLLILSLPTLSMAAVGRTAGEGNVSDSGEATYTIPIVAPPGINGLTPDIALVYSHRQKERLSGAGWGISGLSEISRCAKTMVQDNASATVTLTSTDRFCFGGTQLRLASGTYGGVNSTYRTEVDAMARFTAYGVAGNGPAWFKVEDKNGLIYEYGNTADSRIESLTNYFTTTAITWALNRIEDREGNEIDFTYAEDGAPYGAHRIDSIAYRGNASQGVPAGYLIDFVYQTQPAADVDTQNAAGSTIQDTKRLTNIDVLYTIPATDVLVRSYKLTYESALSTASRSRLASIQECAGSSLDCFTATNFTYQNGTNGLGSEVSSASTVPAGTKALAIDINGDGRTDLAYPSSAGTGTWYYRFANSSGGYNGAINSGIANTNHAKAIAFDHNSDGLEDILVPYSGTTWWVIKGSTGGLVAPVNTLAPAENEAGDAIALDHNGDGKEDLIYRQGATGGLYVRTRASGNGFSAPTLIVSSSLMAQLLSPVFGGVLNQDRNNFFDANGDGIEDIGVRIKEKFGGHGDPIYWLHLIKVILGGGAGTFEISYDSNEMLAGLPIDMNGDGYTDVAFSRSGSSLIFFRLSTGKSFGGNASVGPSITNLDLKKAIAYDWDNDGYQDLLLPNTSTGTWFYLRSLGTSFAAAVNTNFATNGALSVFRVDANGDGLDDIGYVRSSGVYSHIPHAGLQPDLLKTATDGYGNSITYNYSPITGTVHTKYADAIFPEQDYSAPLYVVSSAVPSTGLGSGTYTLTYTYAGARTNLLGRGLAGFDKKTTQDSRNGVKVSEYFRRDFPYRGRLYKRDVNQSSNTPIQGTTYTWASVAGGTGVQNFQYPYIQQSLEKNYEAGGTYNGTQINQVQTTAVVDAYGTPTSITKVTTEMSGANGAQAGAAYTEQVLHSTMTNNLTTWCLGKPSQTEWVNSHNQTYGTQLTRTITRTWETNSACRLTTEITEPSSSTYKVTRAVGYDAFGNVNSETVTGVNMPARVTTTNFGSTGQFPISTTNPLGQSSTFTWDQAKGLPASAVDPNGHTSSSLFDSFGRKTRDVRVDGTYTDYTITACNSGNSYCGTSYSTVKTKIRASTKRTNGTEIRFDDHFADKLDRVVQAGSQTLGGGISWSRQIYDSLGRLAQHSAPSFSAAPAHYSTTTFDLLNRPTQISRPISVGNPTIQNTTLAYLGLTTTTTDPEGKISTRIADSTGRIYRSSDHAGYYQQFDYDAFGSIRRTRDSLGNDLLIATYAYGVQAHRITSTDMDMGAWTYTPNALGEPVRYTDAKAQIFTATFDKLSRPLTRTEPGASATWTWGVSAAAHNIGALASVSTSGHSDSYAYDTKGRISQRTVVSDATYLINYGYDATSGQLDSLTYPTSTSSYRLKLKYGYGYGILNKVSDFNVPATVFWEGNASDARGNVVQETLGNGLQTIRSFDDITGLPDYIQSGPGGSATQQNMEFSWNKVGSLTQRRDVKRSLTEDFYYDNLYRLDYSRLNSVQNLDLAYDSMGNITSKSDVGTGAWTYHATKKHAVTAAGTNTFGYDANGNQSTRNGQTVTWTSYNYPSHVPNGTKYHDYFYDAGRQRWKQVYFNGSTSETTIFVGSMLEKNTAGSLTKYRHAIFVGNKPVALYTRPSTGSITTQYFLLDHQGSVAEITNTAGAIDVSQNFAAFGQRRDATDWSGAPATAVETAINGITTRGYTFHTNLESSSLIHMNGRIADSLTGRFLSADPYISNPGGTQFFNRYSYVNNNPMTFTDPSGFCAEGITTYVCNFVINSIFTHVLSKIFGSHSSPPPPPPKGCWVAAVSCQGAASSAKLYNILGDLIGLPRVRTSSIWDGGNGRFGSGPCGLYCLSLDDQSTWYGAGEFAHEGALILWPGYDIGTCISEGGCSVVDWAVGVIGIIPGGKGVALGGKGLFKVFSKNADDVGGLVIGKLDDLKKSTGWRTGDHTLNLPPLPPGPGRWAQNARELQNAIDIGKPIRDISPTKAGGFLDRERALLRENGWKFDQTTGLWTPGG